MKKLLVITVLLLVFGSVVQATTVRYSNQRLIIVPTLSTGVSNNSVVKDVTLNFLTASTTILSGSSSGTQDIEDVRYDTTTGATTRNFCSEMSAVGVSGGDTGFPVTYGTQNASVATIDSDGEITYVGDGTTYFTATYLGRTRAYPCTFITNVGGTDYIFNDYVPNSLADHIRDTIDVKITGLTPSATTQNLFSSSDPGTFTWVRNPNHLASTTDLTSIPAYSSATGYQATGVLVAPDIVILAEHTYGGSGSTLYFVTSTSTTVAKTVGSGVTISGTDIRVQKLTTPVTYGITPAKVLANGSVEKFNSSISGESLTATAMNFKPLPAIFIPQDKKVFIGTVPQFTSTLAVITTPFKPCLSTDYTGTYGEWYRAIVGGDSGSPAYFIINNEAVLLGTRFSACGVWSVTEHISAINSAMTSLGSAYQLTTVDLSGFPTY